MRLEGLRRADRADAGDLAAVHEASAVAGFGDAFPPDRYPFPRHEALAGWHELLGTPDIRVLAIEDAVGIVAFAVVRLEWLERLFVHPRAWGRGVGSGLHDVALEELRALGSTECHLWVLELNDRARRFYEHRGWCENGRTKVVPFPPHPLDVGYSRGLG